MIDKRMEDLPKTNERATVAATPHWWVYLVRCADQSIYTGIATDVSRRLAEHRAGGARAARYLRGRGPLRLLVAQPVGDHGAALRVEWRIKRLTANEKAEFASAPSLLRSFIDGASADS
ncbi:MAG: GIY-YIG nuclease family protein [Gammaproteobacteria bacterium]